jgi:hypothetical protein
MGVNPHAAIYRRRLRQMRPDHKSREELLPPAIPVQDVVDCTKILHPRFAPHGGNPAHSSGRPQANEIILRVTHFSVDPRKPIGRGGEQTHQQRFIFLGIAPAPVGLSSSVMKRGHP